MENRYFYCYSKPLKEFLLENGERYIIKSVHEKTKKKPVALDNKPRERKANPTKGGIIAEIAAFLSEKSEFATENVEITNKERMIAFKIGDESYEITLIQKRKPKK